MSEGILVVSTKRRPGWVLRRQGNDINGCEDAPCSNLKVANLRIDLGRGARPGGTGIVPPLRKVAQREGNLMGRARLASMGLSRSSVNEVGGVVAGVDDKVVVRHSVLVGMGEEFRREERREEEGRVQWGIRKLSFAPSYMALDQMDILALILQDSRRENGAVTLRHMHACRISTGSTPSAERGWWR